MKKTSKENIIISEIIEEELGITFSNEEFPLDGWGEVDNWCQTSTYSIVLLECEKGQKHPTTNVLKLWPYLETFSEINIILIHYFFPENKAPKNRIKLCHFLGVKLEKMFFPRFQYVNLSCSPDLIHEEIRKHDSLWMEILLNHGKKLREAKKSE